MWQLFLALNIALFVASTLLRRSFAQSQTVRASLSVAVSYVIGVMPISVIAGLLFPHHIAWSPWVLFLLLSASLLVALFIWFSFMAIKYVPAALNQTIFQLRILITIGLGWLFLSEKLTGLQILGASCILGSGVLAVWAPARAHRASHSKHPQLIKGIVLTLLSAIFLGIGVVIEKAAIQYMDIGAFFIYGFGLQTLWLVLFALFEIRTHELSRIDRVFLTQSFILGIVVAGIGITYFIALSKADNISLIAALTACTLPVTAVAAHVFLRERDNDRLLWLAIILGVGGVTVTAL